MIISVKIVDGVVIEDYEDDSTVLIDVPDKIIEMWAAVEGFLKQLIYLETGKHERERHRQEVLAARASRQNGQPLALTEEQKVLTAKWSKDLMSQYVMPLDFNVPRGIVYPDSPLRKKDDAD